MTPAQKAQLRAMVEALDPVVAAPPAPPPPPPAPPPPPPAPSGPEIYVSHTGNNTNIGTQASPKRTLAGINLNTLEDNTTIKFERGGSYDMGNIRLYGSNLHFSDYGQGNKPVLKWSGGFAGIEFGNGFFDQNDHGNYSFKNLELEGPGGNGESWAFWGKNNVHDVTIEGCTIHNWYTAINLQGGSANERFRIIGNHIRDNRGMGINGTTNHSLIQSNLFTSASASTFVHPIYLSDGNGNVVDNNELIYSVYCTGGHITAHGNIDGLQVTNNIIDCPDASDGSWGISLNPYDISSVQGFTNLVVRGNYLKNVGNAAIVVTAAPGAIIEDNETELTVDRGQVSVLVRNSEHSTHLQGPATVRNNRHVGFSGGFVVNPSGSVVENNVIE